MEGRFKDIISINLFLASLFLIINVGTWSIFNVTGIIGNIHFDPFWITFTERMVYTGGNWQPLTAVVTQPNLSFWLFYASTALNIIFIYRLSRRKETKQNPS